MSHFLSSKGFCFGLVPQRGGIAPCFLKGSPQLLLFFGYSALTERRQIHYKLFSTFLLGSYEACHQNSLRVDYAGAPPWASSPSCCQRWSLAFFVLLSDNALRMTGRLFFLRNNAQVSLSRFSTMTSWACAASAIDRHWQSLALSCTVNALFLWFPQGPVLPHTFHSSTIESGRSTSRNVTTSVLVTRDFCPSVFYCVSSQTPSFATPAASQSSTAKAYPTSERVFDSTSNDCLVIQVFRDVCRCTFFPG